VEDEEAPGTVADGLGGESEAEDRSAAESGTVQFPVLRFKKEGQEVGGENAADRKENSAK
jgi:hypothetical protein